MGSDVHLVHLVHLVPLVLLVRHRIQARWILCCEFEYLGGKESAPLNLMGMTEALDLLLLAQMPPMGLRAPMVSTESPSMRHCRIQADWILLRGLFTQPSRV